MEIRSEKNSVFPLPTKIESRDWKFGTYSSMATLATLLIRYIGVETRTEQKSFAAFRAFSCDTNFVGRITAMVIATCRVAYANVALLLGLAYRPT